jgi:hypothetical protein
MRGAFSERFKISASIIYSILFAINPCPHEPQEYESKWDNVAEKDDSRGIIVFARTSC